MTVSVQGTNKCHDFHHQIHQEWLPPLYMIPYYRPIHHKNLFENYSSVHYNLGVGNHKLLAISIGEKGYLAQMGHDFITPINPGNYPNIPAQITEQQRKMIQCTCQKNLNPLQSMYYSLKYYDYIQIRSKFHDIILFFFFLFLSYFFLNKIVQFMTFTIIQS